MKSLLLIITCVALASCGGEESFSWTGGESVQEQFERENEDNAPAVTDPFNGDLVDGTSSEDPVDDISKEPTLDTSSEEPVVNESDFSVLMPVEVLGKEGTIVERTVVFDAEQLVEANRIFFFANNLSYQNKGSIQVNQGEWINLNHTDIEIFSKERRYGGMQHGGYSSIRFTIPADDLVTGENTFRFRFNASNGFSIGYRIFRMNLLRADGSEILARDYIPEVDPSSWSAPEGYADQESINAGRELWYNGKLWNHLLPEGEVATWYRIELQPSQPMRASCSDCHTQDGRDLAYFSYSNLSIVERAKFHNLTEQQGNQIAAYIRSLDVPNYGRPWNPPYQPGPEIANRPIEAWAAGAGIDAVLESDADMLPYMFPNGTSQEEIDSYFDSDKMYDTTTVPIALQFPDWKRWLPMIHPKDAFGDHYAVENEDGTFSAGQAFHAHNPFVSIPQIREFLETHDHDEIVAERQEFYRLLGSYWRSFRQFFSKRHGAKTGAHWRTPNALADAHMPIQTNGFAQYTRTSLARLMAVKFFEFHQEFQLEEMTQRLIAQEEQPAPRQWLHAMGYNVFEVPPHFTAKAYGANAHFISQPWHVGVYETTVWYELQLILNPGNGRPGTVGPVDYNYHPGFIRKASSIGQPTHVMRYYRAMNNLFQVKSHGYDEVNPRDKKRGFHLRQQGIDNIVPWSSEGFNFTLQLEKVKPGDNLPVKVVNAMLTQLAVELERPQNHPDTYNRTERGSLFTLEYRNREYSGGWGFGDRLYRFFIRANRDGIGGNALDSDRINRVIDWCEIAWPNMAWADVRPDSTAVDIEDMDDDEFIPFEDIPEEVQPDDEDQSTPI